MMSYSQLTYLPSYSWGGNIGGTGYDIADHVTTDIYGDVVVSGKFSGNSDFDISSSTNSYVSTGSSDAFVAKYSGNGSLKWMKAFAPMLRQMVLLMLIQWQLIHLVIFT
ncbi:hypothetical protein [Chryseobacterium balustinum]|uniref:hypothetical protein n=1 Tax=Chryseobacterium balustinum TaxID=246 RepID=UPI003CF317C3